MTTVAIDGPAGAGKSTVAKMVADELGFDYLDTGAMYRALALLATRKGIADDDGPTLGRLASRAHIEIGKRVLVDGQDVTDDIRSEDVSRAVSAVAAHPEVRSEMAALQRKTAAAQDVVMEGRDIGSNVVPEAEAKIFLTASVDERARRRAGQLGVSGDAARIEDIRRDIAERDRADSQREVSPLVKAPGAREVDSTGKNVEEVVAEIVDAVREMLG